MKNKIKVKALAKINLALSILGIENGMHILDSIVTNVDLCDTITLETREDDSIVIHYDNTKTPEGDTAKTMAELLQKTYKTKGVDININKQIPLSSGLGGSSADAAGVARGMSQLYQLGDIPNELLLTVGSDVPYMYIGGNKRIKGKGEQIESITLPATNYALVVPPNGVSTAEAFKLFDKIGGEQADIDELLKQINNNSPHKLTNALQRAAESLNPNVKTAIELLKQAGFTNTVMSGSGSCTIGMETDDTKYNVFIKKLTHSLPTGYKLYKTIKGKK